MDYDEYKQTQAAAMLDAVTARLKNNKAKGKVLYDKGMNLLLVKPKVVPHRRYEDAAHYFYASHLSFRACSRWRHAGDSLVQMAKVLLIMKDQIEAATIYTAASEIYMRIDKAEGLRSLRSAITIYCDLGRFDIAGRLERRIADLHYMNQHFEEAAAHFEKAANFVAGEQMFEQSDICLERAATCFVEVKEYVEAQRLYELIAKSVSQTNLRKFNARDYLFRAALCSLAIHIKPQHLKNGNIDIDNPVDCAQKYEKFIQKVYFYESIDCFFGGSTEQRFLLNIQRFREQYDLDGLADHIYWWNNVRPLDRWCLLMLKVVVDEVTAEQQRLEAVAKREAEREEKRKKAKEAKRMAKMLQTMTAGDVPSGESLDDQLRKISARTDDSSASGASGGADEHGIIDVHDDDEQSGIEGDANNKEANENMVFEGDGDDDDED
jgi:alpha-soluble NSF attachment protein